MSDIDPKLLDRDSFTLKAAYVLVRLAEAAYWTEAPLKRHAQAWGFTACSFLEEEEKQCFIVSTEKTVILAFRGSESVRDWIVNMKFTMTDFPPGAIHTGFSSIRSFWPQVRAELSEQEAERKRLWLTGHSLGGAYAMLAAHLLAETDFTITSLVTYGQPLVGDRDFADPLHLALRDRYHRFIYQNDIVARIPPSWFGYRHAGRVKRLLENGSLEDRPRGVGARAFSVGRTEPPPMSEAEFKHLQKVLAESGEEDTRFLGMGAFSEHKLGNYVEALRVLTA